MKPAPAQPAARPAGGPLAYRWSLPVLTALLGLTLTLLLWQNALAQNRVADQARFEELADRAVQTLANRFAQHTQALTGLKGLFAAQAAVTRAAFRAYVDTLRLGDTPGALGFGFVRPVPRERLEDFLRATRADGAPEFTLRTAGAQPDLFVVEFIAPFERNAATRGLDLGAGAIQRRAAIAAVATDRPTLTEPIRSTIDDRERTGFLLFQPLFTAGQPTATAAERERARLGWVYTPIDLDELVAGLSAVVGDQLDIEIFDGAATGRASLLFDSDHSLGTAVAENAFDDSAFLARRHRRQIAIPFGGRLWQLRLSILPKFDARPEHRIPWYVLVGGLVITGLATTVAHSTQRARRRAVALAETMTVELREAFRFQRTLLESAAYAIISCTPDGTVRVFNAAAQRLLGYPEAEIVGRENYARFHDPAELAARARAFGAELGHDLAPGFEVLVAKSRRRHANEHEWTYVRKDGTRLPVFVSVTPVLGDGGEITAFLAVVVNITARKAHEAELLAAQRAAEAASQAKSEFLATMSHEIRTPMNAVIGFTDLLIDTPLQPQQRDFVEIIRSSGENLIALINDILDFSKIEAGKLSVERLRLDGPAVAESVARALSIQAQGRNLTLTVRLAPDLPRVLDADPVRLRQVLINLVGNALKFTHKGGVTLAVEPAPQTDSTAPLPAGTMQPRAQSRELRAEPNGERPQAISDQAPTLRGSGSPLSALSSPLPARLRFSIIDTGIGIPPEKQTALFQKFSQADSAITRQFGGTGLGLAICKRLVELMDGRIGFSSAAGQGSTFWFELPLAADQSPVVPLRTHAGGATASPFATTTPFATAANATAAAAAVAPEPAAPPRRILVADDNRLNQRLVQVFLAKLNCTVTFANNGLEALNLAQAQPFDLVLMDHQMPVMDGCEATRAIREWERTTARPARLPIIALTANAMENGAEFYRAAGMDDYLTKPIQMPSLTRALDAALATPAAP